MKTLSFSLLAAVVPLFAAACSSGSYTVGTDQSGAVGDPSVDGGSCASDNDCESGFQCAFKQADACAAKGRCFDTRGLAVCEAYSAGCACNGETVNVACQPFPDGYTANPIAHAGECGVTAADGGGAPCTTNDDCGGGMHVCRYKQSEGCSAVGYCVDETGIATCAAYSPGCACDGTEINVACQYPGDTTDKPLAHAGSCDVTAMDGGPAPGH